MFICSKPLKNKPRLFIVIVCGCANNNTSHGGVAIVVGSMYANVQSGKGACGVKFEENRGRIGTKLLTLTEKQLLSSNPVSAVSVGCQEAPSSPNLKEIVQQNYSQSQNLTKVAVALKCGRPLKYLITFSLNTHIKRS